MKGRYRLHIHVKWRKERLQVEQHHDMFGDMPNTLDVIRQPLVFLEIDDYPVLVKRLRRLVIYFQNTYKCKDQYKRKSTKEREYVT
ncbi:hypothetical protein IEQ34_003398 [Dendrobium chrysotoxum]|uniref:Uncharacterized protein n=1 Tax=Dendrobium chrysotoxum TaxID=161865 RepID=A0AAV7HM21_DENCH|nr:hypothetical protein IEQ34_003398 [Dendrobium chrysotoxum]